MTSPDAAALLADPARRALLHPFLDRTSSLAGAARELDLPLPRLHYWARRFLNLGLIEVVDVRKRAGRAVRLYRSTARAFFVPFEASSAETFEAKLVRDEAALQARLSALQARSLRQGARSPGTLVWRVDEGLVRAAAFPRQPSEGVVFGVWFERPLGKTRALALKAELLALVERYAALPTEEDAGGVLLRVALAPTGRVEDA
ncbi:hypothetical protein [Deinococcus pimensis]|uniref:hypothetical protein n=1 Tax=Deinococcus pimensis TaxID=309888 RepID=UPI0004824BBC|nr:hypothetical protein [Deinococcus pimensis]